MLMLTFDGVSGQKKLFFWNFYSSNNPEKYHSFHIILGSTTVVSINNNNDKVFEQQISLLWFLKDQVTLD